MEVHLEMASLAFVSLLVYSVTSSELGPKQPKDLINC